jgi:hypothetical protein
LRVSVWTIVAGLTGLCATGLVVVVARLVVDPPCPRCAQRDWSKGVPPWRCRRCGERYRPGRGFGKTRTAAHFEHR